MKKQFIKALALVCALALIFSGCDGNLADVEPVDNSSTAEPIIESEITFTQKELEYAKFVAGVYENYETGQSLATGENFSNFYTFAFGWLRENDMLEKYLDYPAYSYCIDERVLKNVAVMSFKDYETYDTGISSYYYGVDYQISDIELREVSLSEDDTGILKITYDRYVNDYSLGTRVSYYFEKVEKDNNIPPQYKYKFEEIDHMVRLVKVENEDSQKFYTEPRTIKISSKEDFLQFMDTVNNGRFDEQLNIFVLTVDIDLGGEEFTPIGINKSLLDAYDWRDNTLSGFSGTFDGGGHTISGLNITNPPVQGYNCYAGLFGQISPQGIVKNLNIKDAYVDSTVQKDGEIVTYTGILAGSSNGTIVNCNVSGEVKGSFNVGGLAGHVSSYNYSGPYISNCGVEATVTGSNSVGGFAGTLHGINVTSCYFLGTVYVVEDDVYFGTPNAFGGFAGYAIATSITNCASSAEIKTLVSANWVASFIGYEHGSLSACYYDETLSHWKGVTVTYPNQQYVYNDYELEALPHDEIMARIKGIALAS